MVGNEQIQEAIIVVVGPRARPKKAQLTTHASAADGAKSPITVAVIELVTTCIRGPVTSRGQQIEVAVIIIVTKGAANVVIGVLCQAIGGDPSERPVTVVEV